MSASVRPEEDVGRPVTPTLFVSDPSAEAERITGTLRARGYTVVDVPLSMLVARVAVQRPRVILLDADGDGALACVARMRELPDSDGIDVIFMGRAGAALADAEDALAHEGSGFFARPVDVTALLRKIESLAGEPVPAHQPRPSSLPPSVSAKPSLPPASMRQEGPGIPRPPGSMPRLAPLPPSLPGLGADATKRGVQGHVSNELEQLLAEAEQRVGGQAAHESLFPSPDEELEAVLPADVLASLDEPIDDEELDEVGDQAMGALSKGTTSGGSRQQTTGSGTHARPPVRPPPTDPPGAPKTHGGTSSGSTTGARGHTEFSSAGPPRTEAQSNASPRYETNPPPTAPTSHEGFP